MLDLPSFRKFITCDHPKNYVFNTECPSCAVNELINEAYKYRNIVSEYNDKKESLKDEYFCKEVESSEVAILSNNLVSEGWNIYQILNGRIIPPYVYYLVIANRRV